MVRTRRRNYATSSAVARVGRNSRALARPGLGNAVYNIARSGALHAGGYGLAQGLGRLGNYAIREIMRYSTRAPARRIDQHPIGPRPPAARGRAPQMKMVQNSQRPRYVRKGRRVTRQSPLRVSIKIERGQQTEGWNAVYVGGTTHPTYATLRVLSMALVRYCMVKAKIDFSHFNEFMLFPIAGGSNVSFYIWYREEGAANGAMATASTTSNGKTFQQFADDIATLFVANISTTGSRRLFAFGLHQTQQTVPMIASQYYLAEDVYVTVKGESGLQVQNRTAAEGGSDNSDSVLHNPLRGKYYQFSSNRPVIRNGVDAGAANKTSFPYDVEFGQILESDRNGAAAPGTSSWVPSVENALRKPPPGNLFSNCATTKYVGMSSGEILKSKVQFTATMKLSRWMDRFAAKFEQTTTKTLAGLIASSALDPWEWRVGRSHMYGMEKSCDTTVTNSNEIRLGHEHNLFMVASVSYRPHTSTLPLTVLPVA